MALLQWSTRNSQMHSLPSELDIHLLQIQIRKKCILVMIMSFWVVTPCRLVGRYQDGDSMFLQNAGIYRVYTASQP
jgi:hypothetical protein